MRKMFFFGGFALLLTGCQVSAVSDQEKAQIMCAESAQPEACAESAYSEMRKAREQKRLALANKEKYVNASQISTSSVSRVASSDVNAGTTPPRGNAGN